MDYPENWPRKQIGVASGASYERGRALFDALEKVFPARFRPLGASAEGLDGAICLESSPELCRPLAKSSLPTFLVDPQSASRRVRPRATRFVGRPGGQPHLQGRSITWKQAGEVGLVDVKAGDAVIALADEQPIWVERRNALGHRVVLSGALPEYNGAAPLIMDLIRGAFPASLPLHDFLREVTAFYDYEPPPIRACFMFDDPNLHWTGWGHLDYRELIREAELHDYHVSVATVPIDTWYTNPAAASLFRDHANRISLLMHGVNHTHAELLRPRAAHVQARELAHGLRLLDRLEQRHGLRVSRIMAPPHHACGLKACKLMLDLGCEAACVGWLSLVKWNPDECWSSTFGLGMTEFLAGGFPVIPRFNFADRDDARILLANFFRQPLVLIGHHTDVAAGLEILAEIAAKIRTLGDIQWCDMTTIARGSFLTKRMGNVLWIRMQTRHVEVSVTEGVEAILVDRPWLAETICEPLLLQCSGSSQRKEIGGRVVGPLPVSPGPLNLSCPSMRDLSVASYGRQLLPPLWPFARRVLCEARDRIAPVVRRWSKT